MRVSVNGALVALIDQTYDFGGTDKPFRKAEVWISTQLGEPPTQVPVALWQEDPETRAALVEFEKFRDGGPAQFAPVSLVVNMTTKGKAHFVSAVVGK